MRVPVSELPSACSPIEKPRFVIPSSSSRSGASRTPLPKSTTRICQPPPVFGATRILPGFNVVIPIVAAGDQTIELTVDGVPNAQNLFIVIGQ